MNLNQKTNIVKGGVYLTASTFIATILGYLLYLILARILGPANFGIYGVVIGILSAISKILLSSIQQTTSKFVSENQENAPSIKNRLLFIIFLIGTSVSIIYAFSSKIIAYLLNDPSLTILIAISAFIIIPNSLYGVLQGYLNGQKQFKKQAFIRVVYAVLRVSIIITAVLLGYSVGGAIAGFLIATILTFLLNYVIVGDFFAPKKIKIRKRDVLKLVSPIIGTTAILYALPVIGTAFVKSLLDVTIANTYAGFYTAANSIGQIPFLILASLPVVLFPTIAKLNYEKNSEKKAFYVKESSRFTIIILSLFCFLIAATSKSVVELLYSKQYYLTSEILIFLIFGFGFLTFMNIALTILNSVGKHKTSLKIGLTTMIITIILNFILIPKFNIIGSALSLTIATFIGVILSILIIQKSISKVMSITSFIRIIASGLIIFGITKLIEVKGLMLIPLYAGISIVYLLLF